MGAVRLTAHGALVTISAVLVAGCTPIHGWHAHTTSAPGQYFDVAALAPGPVATLRVLTPGGLEGFRPSLSQSLSNALAEAAPSLHEIPELETVNVLNERGLAREYGDLLAGFLRSGILERSQLHRIGSALHARCVLLPGLAAFNEILADRFEVSGLKVVRNRITTLRLWLQLWDTETGRMLWESSGEANVASALLMPGRTVPFDSVARRLWLRMIRDAAGGRRRLS